MAENTDFESCCKAINPCEAVCLLNEAMLNLALGKTTMSYKVGEETFNLVKPSLSDMKILLMHYEGLCNKSNGKPARRRAKFNLVYGKIPCTCHLPRCRCK